MMDKLCPNCGYENSETFSDSGSALKRRGKGGSFGKKYKCPKCGFAFTKDHLKFGACL